MRTTLLMALALMFVLEGILPFVAPHFWRDIFRRMTSLSDGQIRFFGLSSMLLGVVLFFLVNRFAA